jgi:hypothetical protein
MILSCDPPRHAFLIHFGKRCQPRPLQALDVKHHRAIIEMALDLHSTPPSLVAVHFVRHGFKLPFISPENNCKTDFFDIKFCYQGSRFYFYFSHAHDSTQALSPHPGIGLLISEAVHFRADATSALDDRSILIGFFVDTEVVKLEIDMSEFVFEFGADNLKDVPVTLFVDR